MGLLVAVRGFVIVHTYPNSAGTSLSIQGSAPEFLCGGWCVMDLMHAF